MFTSVIQRFRPTTQSRRFAPDVVDEAGIASQVIEALRQLYDPELPVNIYDLGLIYALHIDATGVVRVRMTLTAPACPVAQSFPDRVAAQIRGVAGVADAKVELVWEPPWSSECMSEAARLKLGMF